MFIYENKYLSVSENPCLCFKPASRSLLFSKMNSRKENCSKLSFTARIINKYSLERFLSICSEKMSEGFLKFHKLIIQGGKRQRNDVLTTCKAVIPRGGKRKIAVLFPQ